MMDESATQNDDKLEDARLAVGEGSKSSNNESDSANLGSPKCKRDFQSCNPKVLSAKCDGESLPKKASFGRRISKALPKLYKLLPSNATNNIPQYEGISKQVLNLLLFAEKRILLSSSSMDGSREKSSSAEQALKCVQGVLDYTWEQLNTGHWRDVPIVHRHVYSIASLIKILSLLQCEAVGEETSLRLALKAADMGLLLGAPLPAPNDCLDLTVAANVLSSTLAQITEQSDSESVIPNHVPDKGNFPPFIPKGITGSPVLEIVQPSVECFRSCYFVKRVPVKIKGCISHWPALKKWCDLGYMQKVAGARTVPIEIGSHYAHPDYSQKLMTVSDFIEHHVIGGGKLGYLAQHQLFEQVPELRADIYEPEYCCLSDDSLVVDEPDSDCTDINAWFGPRGTVSPLHHDPKHNLLAQVVGSKRVLLFPPEASASLYPHPDRLLNNTAQVDPENPDYQRYPLFENVGTPIECNLEAGDMLYIPPKFWHHVRSLSVSFSVSFWWK